MKQYIRATFLLAFSTINISNAAEIVPTGKVEIETVGGWERTYFKLALSGPIIAGDSTKAAKLISEDDKFLVSLNSPGGNFREGLLLAKLFRKKKVLTVIEDGASCFSSCAIAFLGGAITGDEELIFNGRSIAMGAQLGFQAPYLESSDEIFDKEAVEFAYDIAVKTIVDFIEIAQSFGVKPVVATTLMAPQREEYLIINTVDQLGVIGIAIQGIISPKVFTSSMARNICINGWGWRASQPSVPMGLVTAEIIKDLGWNAGRSTFIADTDYFGPNRVVKRTVVPVAYGGEGGYYFCVVDHVTEASDLNVSCRGYIFAYDKQEALEKARRLDDPRLKQYSIGIDDMNCYIPWIVEPLKGYETSLKEKGWAFVPPATALHAINGVLADYIATEDRL